MSTRRLVYFDAWTDPVAGEILGQEANIDVVRLEIDADESRNWHELAQAHGYQALTRSEANGHPEVGEQWLPGAELIARCPSLLAVCSAGAGYDVVDVEACTEAGVIVCNNSGPGAEAVAEHALGLMLVLSKKIAVGDRAIRRGPPPDRIALRGSELLGKTLGIVGLGSIGTRLASMCRDALEMRVLAFDPFLNASQVACRGGEKVELRRLLEQSDFVVVSCPLTPQTTGLFGPEEFGRMKPTAFFVTTARGEIHSEGALFEALECGRIAGAGLDVFHREPPRHDHPLLTLDNVVATPHTAGITHEATRAIAAATAEQWIAIFGAELPPRLVNPEAWPRYAERFEEAFGLRPAAMTPGGTT